MKKHGMRHTSEYNTWLHMKDRCNNPKNRRYKDYGGRGITICKAWQESFLEFYNDMGIKPKNSTLERINNNGNYIKNNCKWATKEEQNRNQRSNIVIEYNGMKKILSEWSKFLGIKYMTLYNRLFTYNWSIERAFKK